MVADFGKWEGLLNLCVFVDINDDDGGVKLVSYSPSGVQYPWYDYLTVQNVRHPRSHSIVDNLNQSKSLFLEETKLISHITN